MPGTGYTLMRSLAEQQVVIPYLQNSFKDLTNWPAPELMRIDDPRRHDSKTDDYFHPSVHAAECALGCYLRLHPESRAALRPEKASFTSVFTPMMGTVMHTIIQQKLIVDKLVKPEDVEVALVDEERHWRGHADLMFRGELVDIKTMYARKFAMTKEAQYVWEAQLNPYMDALGLKTSLILVVEQGWPYGMKEFRVNKKNEILDDIYEKWAFVAECIKNSTPPSHEGCDNQYCTVRTRYDGDIPL